jgi:DNA-binding transcriptional LysR family regulator
MTGAGSGRIDLNTGIDPQRSLVELRHLRVFVTLAEELHFGRTAVRLHLTQPSVSGQLRQLEDALGVRLIRRHARQVSLNDVGVAFLRDARRVLDQADAAVGGVRRFQEGLDASLRVGYLYDAIPERLPVALRRIAHDFPQTRILLTTGDPYKLLDDPRDDLLDVAVISLPAPVAGLRVTPVGFERAVAAVSSNLDREDASPLELLAQRTMLTLPRRQNPAFYDALIAALRSVGLPGALTEIEAVSVESVLMRLRATPAARSCPSPRCFDCGLPGSRFAGSPATRPSVAGWQP